MIVMRESKVLWQMTLTSDKSQEPKAPMVKLVPGTPLFKALRKINPPHGVKGGVYKDIQKFLSGAKFSLQKTADLIATVFSNIDTLVDSSTTNKKVIVQSLHKSLQVLAIFTDQASQELNDDIDQHKKKLIESIKKHNKATQQKLSVGTEYKNLQSKLEGLNNQKKDLDKEISKITAEIQKLNKKIKEEKNKRKNAALDLIPFYGLIDGIIKKQLKRAIPFYSQVVGIISQFSRAKEIAQRRLNLCNKNAKKLSSEINSVSSIITSKSRLLKKQIACIKSLISLISSTDSKIKQQGQNLTFLRNTHQFMKEMSIKYKFLQLDADFTIEMIEAGL